MCSVLKGLSPYRFMDYFEEICKIPHGSGNTKAISDYCVSFAKKHGLFYLQDAMGNVYIRKEATSGREQDGGILLQGHLDMVTEQTPESKINMEQEGLRLAVDGDYIYAQNTTLGGDDGIAIAYALAVLEDQSLSHPVIEAVFTVDEEIGLLGAQGMQLPTVTAKYMLNLDSEEQGVLWVGCAGGMTAQCRLPFATESFNGTKAVLRISGLIGGHSGAEIDKERGNAAILLGNALYKIKKHCLFALKDLHGGFKDNAIPREAEAVLLFDMQAQYFAETNTIVGMSQTYKETKMQEISDAVAALEETLQKQFLVSDPNIRLTLSWEGEGYETVCDLADTDKIIFFLNMLPNGVQHMSPQIPELVETSLNLGVLALKEDFLDACISVRSSVESRKQDFGIRLQYLTENLGGDYSASGNYPGWAYEANSHLRDVMCTVYKEMFGEVPNVAAVHAGLECGYFKQRYPWLDIVSFGPNILNIHTTEEKMSVSSCNAMYEYLLKILETVK